MRFPELRMLELKRAKAAKRQAIRARRKREGTVNPPPPIPPRVSRLLHENAVKHDEAMRRERAARAERTKQRSAS